MSNPGRQPEYVVVPREYEGLLRSAYETKIEALQLSSKRQLAVLKEEHSEALSKRDLELLETRFEVSSLKQQVLTWRLKSMQCDMKKESAKESTNVANANISFLKLALQERAQEIEKLLLCVQELQERVQTLTAICQGEHRSKVAQQGQLASTDAEVHQLQRQLLQSHDVSEGLMQRLAGEHAMLEAVRSQAEELRQQLSKEQIELQAQASAYAALKADCESLRASLVEEKRARAGLEVRVGTLTSDLKACNAELQAAEQRLARVTSGRTADTVLVHELQQCIEQLKGQLETSRRDKEHEQRHMFAELEREQALRESLKQQCAEVSKQCDEDHRNYLATQAQLNRQLGEKDLELQRAKNLVNRLEEQLASTEKRAAARAERINELEVALERSSQKLCQQFNVKDAAVAGLQEQLDQQRRQIERKDAELLESQDAHARQLQQLERRLAQQEAAARDQEAYLQRQLDDTQRELQSRLAQVQASLTDRDAQIKKLMDGHAADASFQKRRIRQLEDGHSVEVARLRARIRELERQLTDLGSPAEPPMYEARAGVDMLLNKLLISTSDAQGDLLGSICEDDEEDGQGPSADLILCRPQLHVSQGCRALQTAECPSDAVAPAARQTRQPLQPPLAEVVMATAAFVDALDKAPDAASKDQAKKDDTRKRVPELCNEDDGRPASRGRGRKAAKLIDNLHMMDDDRDPIPTKSAGEVSREEAPSQAAPADDDRATRAGSRRRAAHAGQARTKAMAAAVANNSEPGMKEETLGGKLNGGKTRAVQCAAVPITTAMEATAVVKATVAATDVNQAIALPETNAACAKRGRSAGGRKKGSKPDNGVLPQGAVQNEPGSQSNEPSEPTGHATEPVLPPASREPNNLMPPPSQAPARRRGAATAAKPNALDAVGVPATQDVDLAVSQQLTQPHTSEPPTQLQPQCPPPATGTIAAVGHLQQREGAVRDKAPEPPAGFSQQGLPTVSQSSFFSSFKAFEAGIGRNPLATLNPKVLEHARGRARVVPFTSVQQWKIAAPSLHKNSGGQQAGAAAATVTKKALPQLNQSNTAIPGPSAVTRDVMPADVLLQSLRQPPNPRTGRKAG